MSVNKAFWVENKILQHRQNTKDFIADKREKEENKDTGLQTSFTMQHQKVLKTVSNLMPIQENQRLDSVQLKNYLWLMEFN